MKPRTQEARAEMIRSAAKKGRALLRQMARARTETPLESLPVACNEKVVSVACHDPKPLARSSTTERHWSTDQKGKDKVKTDVTEKIELSPLQKATEAIRSKVKEVSDAQTADRHVLDAELAPVVEEAAQIRTEIDALSAKYGAQLDELRAVDRQALRAYNDGSIDRVSNQLYRMVDGALLFLNNGPQQMADIPKRVRQIERESKEGAVSRKGLANGIKDAVKNAKACVAQFPDTMRVIGMLVEDIAARLARSGVPAKLTPIVYPDSYPPKLNEPPKVILKDPQADF